MDVPVNVDEIAALLRTAEEKAGQAITHLDTVGTSRDECLQSLSDALQGSTNAEVGQAIQALAGIDLGTPSQLIQRAITTVSAYRTRLVGQPPSEPARPAASSSAPASASTAATEPAEVKAARAQLPPPVVKGTRTKTHGRWSTPDAPADLQPVTSGTRDDLYQDTQQYLQENGMGQTVIGSHVETKVAVHMRKAGIRNVSVTINHRPCDGPLGCDTLLPQVLPEGSTLTVYGTAPDGSHTKDTYTGRQDS